MHCILLRVQVGRANLAHSQRRWLPLRYWPSSCLLPLGVCFEVVFVIGLVDGSGNARIVHRRRASAECALCRVGVLSVICQSMRAILESGIRCDRLPNCQSASWKSTACHAEQELEQTREQKQQAGCAHDTYHKSSRPCSRRTHRHIHVQKLSAWKRCRWQ